MTLRFEIPGKPFAKQRPRFDRRSGRAYTPGATVSFERTVGQWAIEAGAVPLEGPVRLTIIAIFEPAPSWPKKRRAAAMWNPHVQKPDLDNIEKAVLDGLNRIAFVDDAQVADVVKRKMWGEPARTIIEVAPIGPWVAVAGFRSIGESAAGMAEGEGK